MYIANPKVATKYNQKMYRGETWNAKNILQRKKKTSPSLFTIQHIIANTLLNTSGISDHQTCGGFLPPRNTQTARSIVLQWTQFLCQLSVGSIRSHRLRVQTKELPVSHCRC